MSQTHYKHQWMHFSENMIEASFVFGRLMIVLALQIFVVFALQSDATAHLLQQTQHVPIGFGLDSLGAFFITLLLIGYLHEPGSHTHALSWPSNRQLIRALIALIAYCGLVTFVTHPSKAFLTTMSGLANISGSAWPPFIRSTILTAFYGAAPILLFLVFPYSFLHKNWKLILLLIGMMYMYFYANLIQYVTHPIAADQILNLSALPLSFMSDLIVDPNRYMLGLHNFNVIIGPGCLGKNAMFLFTGFYGVHCIRNAVDSQRALMGYVAGMVALSLLNVFRISSVLLVGAHVPLVVTHIFHGAIGAVILFAVILFYIRCIFPVLDKKTKKGGKKK